MPYVTGTEILAHVGKVAPNTPTAAEIAWAGKCADAIEGAIATRLEGNTPNASGVDELEVAALTDGAALFNSKSAPHGVQTLGVDQTVVRLGADSMRALDPVIARVHPTAGIGIG